MTKLRFGNAVLTLTFILNFSAPVHADADIKLKVTGSCEQLRMIIRKGKENITAADSIVFMAYRALANGQVTIYNQALLAAGYKIPLVSNEQKKPDIFFLKKMSIACAQVTPEPGQYTPLVTNNIAALMAELYTHQKIDLNFKKLLEKPLDEEATYSEKLEIGLGGEICQNFSDTVRRFPAYEAIYRTWLIGYLTPYIMMKKLGPKQGIDMADDVYLKTTTYCTSNPEANYARAILDTFKEIEGR